ncbi:glycosyltransferase family 2 protein [Daejeonella oryzae]|uniref:glycosyltransferase family 2 protein n=1 Tax=Daejeonella oryzae TaxID=1122943 RepID=UPI00040CEF94|nr:glycosyltransferase [Daejeonella oryzae]
MALTVISFLSILLTICYVSVVLYFRRGWINLPWISKSASIPKTYVSVLIAARNEEDKLDKTIRDILAQNYPGKLLELIIVDDHSTDRTAEIISSYAAKGVILIKLNEHEPLNSYKKKAISEAIAISKGELIVTTDADCRMGPEWLANIVSYYEENNFKLISSPVAYFEENSAFEEMQTLEFLYLIGLGASTIGNKMPSTCNGANLAYRKDVFFELKGFKGIDDLASGDDELFLHKVASRYPDGIGFCKSREATVYTHAKPTLAEFIQQRKRWASKSTKYKNKSIVVLGVSIWFFNLLILINAILGFFDPQYWDLALISLVCKLLTELAFLIPMARFANRRELLWYQPLLTVLHIFYFVYIGIAGNSGKYNWKGRMVR